MNVKRKMAKGRTNKGGQEKLGASSPFDLSIVLIQANLFHYFDPFTIYHSDYEFNKTAVFVPGSNYPFKPESFSGNFHVGEDVA